MKEIKDLSKRRDILCSEGKNKTLSPLQVGLFFLKKIMVDSKFYTERQGARITTILKKKNKVEELQYPILNRMGIKLQETRKRAIGNGRDTK